MQPHKLKLLIVILFLHGCTIFVEDSKSKLSKRFIEFTSSWSETGNPDQYINKNDFSLVSVTGENESKEEWLYILEKRNKKIKSCQLKLKITIESYDIKLNGSSAEINGIYQWLSSEIEGGEIKTIDTKIGFTQHWVEINKIWYLSKVENKQASGNYANPSNPQYASIIPASSECAR